MTEIEFRGWPKISRLFRDCTITEKIDGTNGAIGIKEFPFGWHVGGVDDQGINRDMPENAKMAFGIADDTGLPQNEYLVYAQSRKRIITPEADNHGFARWVWDNANTLTNILGPGLHFGEWWGAGIQRGYGLPRGEKRFSLFNTKRWGIYNPNGIEAQLDSGKTVPIGLTVVPILYEGPFSTGIVNLVKKNLWAHGSLASSGFKPPEGVVVYHSAGNVMFKTTFDKDDKPKSAVDYDEPQKTVDWNLAMDMIVNHPGVTFDEVTAIAKKVDNLGRWIEDVQLPEV